MKGEWEAGNEIKIIWEEKLNATEGVELPEGNITGGYKYLGAQRDDVAWGFWGHDGRHPNGGWEWPNWDPSVQTDRICGQSAIYARLHICINTHTPRSVCVWRGGIAFKHLNYRYYIQQKLTTSLMFLFLTNPCKPTGCRCAHDRWNERYPNYWHHHSHPSLGHLCGRNGMGGQGMTASKVPQQDTYGNNASLGLKEHRSD